MCWNATPKSLQVHTGSVYVDDVPLRSVWALSDKVCWLCDKPIPSLEEASRDHVYPRSKGGRMVKLAHRRCNYRKGDLEPDALPGWLFDDSPEAKARREARAGATRARRIASKRERREARRRMKAEAARQPRATIWTILLCMMRLELTARGHVWWT